MATRQYEKTNHKTGNKITTNVEKTGKTTRVTKTLQKRNGIFGTYVLAPKKVVSDKSYRRG